MNEPPASGIKEKTNTKISVTPSTTFNIPPQPKISSNFDKPTHRNEKPHENIQPPLLHAINQPTITTTTQNTPQENMQPGKVPSANRRNDQMVSKPSFAATVQAKLPTLNNEDPIV